MATLYYDFDEKSNTGSYEYEADLSDWIDGLDNETKFDIMYDMFKEHPKYFKELNVTKEELETITTEDVDMINEILSLFSEFDLIEDNRDLILDFYHDDAYSEYEMNR